MKPIYSVVLLPFLIILLLVTPVKGSSEWVKYKWSNVGDVYLYNKDSIKNRAQDIVQVWTKVVFSDAGRRKFIQKLSKGELSTARWDKLSYFSGLQEIDCKKKMTQVFSITFYETNGKVLDSHSSDKPKWEYIPPDSTGEFLRKKVCK